MSVCGFPVFPRLSETVCFNAHSVFVAKKTFFPEDLEQQGELILSSWEPTRSDLAGLSLNNPRHPPPEVVMGLSVGGSGCLEQKYEDPEAKTSHKSSMKALMAFWICKICWAMTLNTSAAGTTGTNKKSAGLVEIMHTVFNSS